MGKFIGKLKINKKNNANLGIIIKILHIGIVSSNDMVWDGDSDQRISKIFEDNHTRASSNPLEMGLSAQVGAGSEVGLGLRSQEQLVESLAVLS